MTEPSPPGTRADAPQAAPAPAGGEQGGGQPPPQDRFAGLAERPVAEHVEVFEDEHARLTRELGAIDPL